MLRAVFASCAAQQKTPDINLTSRVTLFLGPSGFVREPDSLVGHLIITGRSSDSPAPQN
jgi:hypothetical protein